MRIIPINSINSRVKTPEDFVAFSEEEYRFGILHAALGIIQTRRDKPIVLLTGPSGSGKTGTAHRLRAELENLGYTTHIISMDNYFVPLRDGIEGVDLEAPDRVDIPLFQEQAGKILEGREVVLPVFNFAEQDRTDGARFTRKQGEIVIFEGIHMLNPLISGTFSEQASTVYVSVRTRVKGENNPALHPSKIRLLRRFVRDKLYRGRSFLQTMEYFNNVQRGEKLHIMPFKKLAQFDIDTFLPYEPCVYKKHIYAELKAETNANALMKELLAFFEELEEVGDELVPHDSLVREFIGGSSLME